MASSGATPEGSADYLERVNLKALMEWLTAKCILHRPDDPLRFCSQLTSDKLAARGDRPYDRRATAHYLSECYEEAMVSANEFGIISGPEKGKRNSKVPASKASPGKAAGKGAVGEGGGGAAAGAQQQGGIGGLEALAPLAAAMTELAESCSVESMAEGLLETAKKVFNADQAAIYLAVHGPAAALDRAGARGAPQQHLAPGASVLSAALAPGSKARVISDTAEEASWEKDALRDGGGGAGDARTSSLMLAPLPALPGLLAEGEPVPPGGGGAGVLVVGNRRGGGAYRAGEEGMLEAFAALMAALLSHAAHYEHKEHECVKYRSMMEIIQATNQQDMGVHHILYTISACLPRVCDAHKCTTFIVDEEHQELWAVQGEINIRMPKDRGIAGAVATSGKLINIPNAYADPRFNQQVDLDTGYRTQTILAVPITAEEGKVLGVVQLINKAERGNIHAGVFNVKDEEILKSFLGTLAPLLQSSRLFRSRSLDVNISRSSAKEEHEFTRAASHRELSTSLRQTHTTMEIAEGEEEDEIMASGGRPAG